MSKSVSRTVGAVAAASALSLLATVCSIAAVKASQLRWDGTFCSKPACEGPAYAGFAQKRGAAIASSLVARPL